MFMEFLKVHTPLNDWLTRLVTGFGDLKYLLKLYSFRLLRSARETVYG